MATLIFSSQRAATAGSAPSMHSGVRLREWLNGRWGVLYSNPEDFAPHPSTPRGFIACLSGEFEHYEVKPLTLGNHSGAAPESWLDVAMDDQSVVVVAGSREHSVIDLAERALARQLARLKDPFVMILDTWGRCRSTLSYRPRRIDRPRTLTDILNVVDGLRR